MREAGSFSRFCQVIAGIRFCIHYSGRRCSLKHQIWKPFALWILLAEGVGALAGWLTREGARIYSAAVRKPPLTPPGPVFPIVWSILFALMGFGAALVWRKPASRERTHSLRLFIVQLAVNFFWSILFFNGQVYGFALVWLMLLWALIAWMILSFRSVDRTAAMLQIPYLLWVTFAAYLNAGVWLLNR